MAMLSAAPTSGATDALAIAASLDDPHAFEAIFERHFEPIHRFLRARVGAHLAEELAAETFVQAFGSRARYDRAYPDARPWLFAIAANLVRSQRRAEARKLRAYSRIDAREAAGDEDAAASRLDAARRGPAVARALAALPEADRDTLLLVAWGELTYDDAARALDIPVGTVRSRLHRARAAVRGALEIEEATEMAEPPGPAIEEDHHG
jgi:RNA polymerase sigma-70 factor (ECF subfamily)